MHKILVIAKREYQAMVRTKAFLITMIMMPVLLLGSLLAQKLLEGRVDISDKTILVCDATGKLFPRLNELVGDYNKTEIFDETGGKQLESKVVLELGPAPPLEDGQRLEFSQRIKKQGLYAFVEIPAAILDREGGAKLDEIRFHTEKIGFGFVRRWFQTALNQTVHGERLRVAGLDAGSVGWATAPVKVASGGLFVESAGTVSEVDESARGVAFFVPIVMMMLMFMSIMISAQPMLQSVIEEKQQRIAEVLLGSVRPFDLMLGKLAGNVGVSLTIVGVYLLGGYAALRFYGHTSVLPPDLMAWFLVYQVLAVLMFGSVFIAIGAACTETKEAQTFLTPAMLVLVLPMLVWFQVLQDPMSKFATWLSFFPPSTPMLMILRMAATSVVPLWQPLAGIAGVVATTLICVFAAGRVFRIGILSQGKAPRLTELLRWMITG